MCDQVSRETKMKLGSGGIRTHASEETGALNQRLRPLGHATRSLNICPKDCKSRGALYLSVVTGSGKQVGVSLNCLKWLPAHKS